MKWLDMKILKYSTLFFYFSDHSIVCEHVNPKERIIACANNCKRFKRRYHDRMCGAGFGENRNWFPFTFWIDAETSPRHAVDMKHHNVLLLLLLESSRCSAHVFFVFIEIHDSNVDIQCETILVCSLSRRPCVVAYRNMAYGVSSRGVSTAICGRPRLLTVCDASTMWNLILPLLFPPPPPHSFFRNRAEIAEHEKIPIDERKTDPAGLGQGIES